MEAVTAARSPWIHVRPLVFGTEPAAVEATVTQLEQWGAEPTVVFDATHAATVLAAQRPDLLVLDLGAADILTPEAAGFLEGIRQDLLRGAPAIPLALLTGRRLATRVGASLGPHVHVAPADDPPRVRRALNAALADASAPVETSAAREAAGAPWRGRFAGMAAMAATLVLLALLGFGGWLRGGDGAQPPGSSVDGRQTVSSGSTAAATTGDAAVAGAAVTAAPPGQTPSALASSAASAAGSASPAAASPPAAPSTQPPRLVLPPYIALPTPTISERPQPGAGIGRG